MAQQVVARLLETEDDPDSPENVMADFRVNPRLTGGPDKIVFLANNCYGQPRTIVISRNEHGRYSWKLRYQDNPVIADQLYTYSYNYFDALQAAKRSALRFVKNLAQ